MGNPGEWNVVMAKEPAWPQYLKTLYSNPTKQPFQVAPKNNKVKHLWLSRTYAQSNQKAQIVFNDIWPLGEWTPIYAKQKTIFPPLALIHWSLFQSHLL